MSEHLIEFLSVVIGLCASMFICMDYLSKILKIVIIIIIGGTKKGHKHITKVITNLIKKK